MSEPYPLPRHAAYIWIADDTLTLAFPPITGSDKGHSVSLPANPAGLSRALAILRDRASALDLRLSNRGTPPKIAVENDARYKEWLKAMKVTKEEKAEAGKMLDELGL